MNVIWKDVHKFVLLAGVNAFVFFVLHGILFLCLCLLSDVCSLAVWWLSGITGVGL